MFDPDRIGWTEFWLRVAVAVFGLLTLTLVVMVVAKILLTLFDFACWVLGKRQQKDESEMHEETARRRLHSLLSARQDALQGPVYVSEYKDYPSRVHVDAVTAQSACVEHLRSEPGPEPHWDWFADGDGWVMRHVGRSTDTPGPKLGGRVTRTEVEG